LHDAALQTLAVAHEDQFTTLGHASPAFLKHFGAPLARLLPRA
jgi:hypothetical protein